ncbi:meiotic nuclear division protein 1 [Paraphysoderma sedebokerense]|nr:meiotic nuclear division protein 1 [Paraphysoderma sedebokerense]
MSKRLSHDEKRKRLLEIFHETKDFFQLKDLEKLAPKNKGIVAQTVKEVLQSLVDDNMVTAEKIGISNYFWSFPSQCGQIRQTKIDNLNAEKDKLLAKKQQLEEDIQQARVGKEESEKRSILLSQLAEAESLRKQHLAELAKFKECDPEVLEAKERKTQVCKDAANRWTDNIFILQSYCTRQMNLESKRFFEAFELPDDFDSIP